MIFLHLIIALIFGKITGQYWWFLLGSVFPDIDHLFIIAKHRLWNWGKFMRTLRFEKGYSILYKTPYTHSVLALVVYSFIVGLINFEWGLLFGSAYLAHLILDWLDIDVKYYLYPLKTKFQGILPIWSKTEQIVTVIGLLVLIALVIIY